MITHPNLPKVDYEDGRCWLRPLPRTVGRYIHGMLFLADWHRTYLDAEDPHQPESVLTVADMFLRWKDVAPQVDDSSMAYHDETTGQRLMQLVRFLDDHWHALDDERLAGLTELANSTAGLLMDDSFHAGLNNHGMLQDLALLRYAAGGKWFASQLELERVIDCSVARLEEYFTRAFARDGAHVENSPGYHLMVARFLRDALPVLRQLEAPASDLLTDIYHRAERFAVHSILPNGYLAPLGDTKVARVRNTGHRDTFAGQAYRYAISEGADGVQPTEATAVFPDSGYAFHRTSWSDPNAYQITFKAAYLSQYHHHNDDLALTLFGRGRWLLTEAGPYGYEYDNPLTKYAFSQFAHNTVVVDGRSLPRVDKSPGGVSLEDLGAGPDARCLHVRGVNTRSASATHAREVAVDQAGEDLAVTVTDTLESADELDHDYEVLWHVGPGVHTFLRSHGVELYVAGEKALEMVWSADVPLSVSLERPSASGRVRAMRFPKFGDHRPGTVVRIRLRGVNASLRTTIRNSQWFYRDWGVAAPRSPWRTWQDDVPVNYLLETNPASKNLVVAFSAMAPDGSFTYNYKRLLDGLPVNRLYVLDDFGEGGAYYFSDHRSTHIRDAVTRLVQSVMNRCSIPLERVAVVGSSKGGSAAIIHGTNLKVGRIVVGAPQVNIGFHVSRNRPNIQEFMAGGTTSEDAEWLDRIIPEALGDIDPETRLDLVVGTRDHHLKRHVPDLVDALTRRGHQHWTVHEVDGLTHSDIGPAFRDFAQDQLLDWIQEHEGSPFDGLALVGTDSGLEVALPGIAPSQSAEIRLLRGEKVVERVPYRRGLRSWRFVGLAAGVYRARVYVRHEGTETRQAMTTNRVTWGG
ncbi:heparinase II/III family protein [Ornithinimicrobium faecis]|uniref:Heparinase II/III family protein n=1 Tax=Ornithinimicrobium faecis TaxID=2934158 RepID=A0ABY4YSR6_9MICO|nr:heparinase II/III family protein [Ornithinimicrobium sp. HY1793]USQ79801.1 heparinase II/III family protein [Ornithinimicrobium sp. HY1793]